MRITTPFLPLRIETDKLSHTVRLSDKSYTFGADGMITSIISEGHELLAKPMRIVMIEDGKEALFDDNYPENESESFIQKRSDEECIICGCKQSERFIINFCNTVKYDGISIGEFQVHKNRECFKFRFNLDNFVKVVENLTK